MSASAKKMPSEVRPYFRTMLMTASGGFEPENLEGFLRSNEAIQIESRDEASFVLESVRIASLMLYRAASADQESRVIQLIENIVAGTDLKGAIAKRGYSARDTNKLACAVLQSAHADRLAVALDGVVPMTSYATHIFSDRQSLAMAPQLLVKARRCVPGFEVGALDPEWVSAAAVSQKLAPESSIGRTREERKQLIEGMTNIVMEALLSHPNEMSFFLGLCTRAKLGGGFVADKVDELKVRWSAHSDLHSIAYQAGWNAHDANYGGGQGCPIGRDGGGDARASDNEFFRAHPRLLARLLELGLADCKLRWRGSLLYIRSTIDTDVLVHVAKQKAALAFCALRMRPDILPALVEEAKPKLARQILDDSMRNT